MTSLSTVFEALGDGHRLSVVQQLAARGEMPVADLLPELPISAPAVSRHLAVLKKAGLVKRRVAGTKRFYSLNPIVFEEIEIWANDQQKFWTQSLDRLAALLKEEHHDNA